MSYGTAAANKTQAVEPGVDTGTRERSRHQGGVDVAPRAILDSGGIQTSVGAQARFECSLDVLLGPLPAIGHLAGTQGSKHDREAVARSRYEAGMKMRRLFVNAGLVGVKAFDMDSVRGKIGDMTDEQAEARADFNALMRKLGAKGEIAAGPYCYHQMPDNTRWLANVRDAHEALCLIVL